MGGWCEQASEQEIALAKAEIGAEGVGCEPASAVTLAGLKKLVARARSPARSASSSSSPATPSRTRSTPSTTTAASCSLGMGCGSSAAALLAGVLLANHFGNLNWTPADAWKKPAAAKAIPTTSPRAFSVE
jgi:hypothetical protein